MGHSKRYLLIRTANKRLLIRRYFTMKGYVTASGYMGYVENEYILFASEDDYFDYMEAI